jgi:integrase/recombinase XerD
MSRTFCGPLAAHFEHFTDLMRSTGARHATLLANIHRLDRFLAHAYPEATTLTKDILSAWFASFAHLRPMSQKRYRSATFQVCKFLHRRNPGTAVREDFEPLRVTAAFEPYIFSDEEIRMMLKAARELRPLTSDPLRPWSMELVIVLLYTAGLRVSEVVRLQVRDYEADLGTLIIRETKFAKTRLVPLSTSARGVVDAYLCKRRKIGLPCGPEAPLRCCPSNHPPCVGTVQAGLARLMRDCGLKPARGHGPRVHDLRHTFAVHRVREWYRQGKDVQALLPHLATFMGHRGLESTQRYLSLTPAVLYAASARFEQFSRVPAPDREMEEVTT